MVAAVLLMTTGCERDNRIVEDDISPNSKSISVNEIVLFLTSITFEEGDKKTLEYAISPNNATNQEVIWASSHPQIANINSNGMLEAFNAGECVITVTTKDGNLQAKCNVTVVACGGVVDLKLGEMIGMKSEEIAFNSERNILLSVESINDSRCPIGVMCVHGGNVYVQFHLKTESGEYDFTLDPHGALYKRDTVIEGMVYELFDVVPYPNIREQQIQTVLIKVTALENHIQYIRTNWFKGKYPTLTVISSKIELDEYYESFQETQLSLSRFKDAVSIYSDVFFENAFLVIVRLMEGSGSIMHKVEKIEENGDIIISRLLPEVGTCDMAEWNIVIAIKNNLRLEQYQVIVIDKVLY